MMKYLLRVTLLVTAIAIFMSCSDKKDPGYNELEQASFDAWMAEHVGDNAERLENGMYITYHGEKQPGGAGNIVQSGDWILLDYKGTDLRDNVYMTRDSLTAYREGTLTAYTYYRPVMFQFSKTYENIPKGLHYALDKELIKKNDSVTLYLPSKLLDKSGILTNDNGYGGSNSYPGSVPTKLIVKLVDIAGVTPKEDEEKLVKQYVTENWGLTERDTITENLYIHIKYNVLTSEDRIKIKSGDTFTVSYESYFLDGYLFDTNIGQLAIDLIGNDINKVKRDTSKYKNPASITRSTMESSGIGNLTINALKKVFESDTLTYDCSFMIAFTSEHGFGTSGNSSSTTPYTQVMAYSPLIVKMTIYPKAEEEEEEE